MVQNRNLILSCCRLLTLAVLALVHFVLCSCNSGSVYPSLLVDADSAYVRGDYSMGDSMLALYEKLPVVGDKDVQMYHNLLRLQRAFVLGELKENDFSMADSLSRFYGGIGKRDKYAKSQLFIGSIYQTNEDYPTALCCYLKAEEMAKDMMDTRLLCLISRQQGDLYFKEFMLDECISCYKGYYRMAVANHDTLRMALAASRMGRVYTIRNDVDNTIFFYKKAIRLAESVSQKDKLLPYARARLCDIYIQIGEYDSARVMMPRDDLNDENWAYWHYAQNHVDSAVCCFRQMLGKYGWHTEVENLRILAHLEQQRGRVDSSLAYYAALEKAEDSLRATSQAESIRRISTQYHYNSIKQERDRMEEQSKLTAIVALFLLIGVFFVMALLLFAWNSYKQKKNAELEREKRLGGFYKSVLGIRQVDPVCPISAVHS